MLMLQAIQKKTSPSEAKENEAREEKVCFWTTDIFSSGSRATEDQPDGHIQYLSSGGDVTSDGLIHVQQKNPFFLV